MVATTPSCARSNTTTVSGTVFPSPPDTDASLSVNEVLFADSESSSACCGESCWSWSLVDELEAMMAEAEAAVSHSLSTWRLVRSPFDAD